MADTNITNPGHVNAVRQNFYKAMRSLNQELTKKIIEIDLPEVDGEIMAIKSEDITHENSLTKLYATCKSLQLDIRRFVQQNDRVTYRRPDGVLDKINSLLNPLDSARFVTRPVDCHCLTWIVTYLNSDVDAGNLRNTEQLQNEMEYRVFLIEQISIIVERFKILYASCLWFHYAKKRFANDTKKFWENGVEAFHLKGDGLTPLLLAVDVKSILMLKFIVSKPQVDFLATCYRSENFYTALHIAALNDDIEAVNTILVHTPLAIKQELLDKQSKPDMYTALHLACMKANVNMIKILIQFGATYNVKDRSQKIPMQYCKNEEEAYNFLTRVSYAFEEARKIRSTNFQAVDIARHDPELVSAWSAREAQTGKSPVELFYETKP